MSSMSQERPRLASQYYIYCDPPDKSGEETMHFVSSQRRVKLRGRSFREFVQRVVPLLDGTRTLVEVREAVRDLFVPADLDECLELLSTHGLLEDAARWDILESTRRRLQPQLNLWQMLDSEPWALQRRVGEARVAVLGLSGMGASAAQALAQVGIGGLRCIDSELVGPADLYGCGALAAGSIGASRAVAIRERLAALAPETTIESIETTLDDDEAVERAVDGCDFVVNCLDTGQVSTVYKLNRVCLKRKIPWTSAAADGLEVVAGPTVFPGETACFLCYRMRAVACALDPQAEFDFQSYLDRHKRDDSARRANLVFGTTLAGQFAGLEALKVVSGGLPPTLRGRILVLDLRDLSTTLHILLRKPWCPACNSAWDAAEGLS